MDRLGWGRGGKTGKRVYRVSDALYIIGGPGQEREPDRSGPYIYIFFWLTLGPLYLYGQQGVQHPSHPSVRFHFETLQLTRPGSPAPAAGAAIPASLASDWAGIRFIFTLVGRNGYQGPLPPSLPGPLPVSHLPLKPHHSHS